VKMDRRIEYECENCGQVSSYKQPYGESFSESGQSGGKSQAAARELSRELAQTVQKQANELLKEWKTKKPELLRYGLEDCPICGYVQSWMDWETIEEKHRSRFVRWPIGIMTIALSIMYFGLFNFDTSEFAPCAVAIGVWAILYFLISAIGKKIQKSADPNAQFGEVTTINEPIITWDEPKITM